MIRRRDSAAESLINHVERVEHCGLRLVQGEQDYARDNALKSASIAQLSFSRQLEDLQYLAKVFIADQDLARGVQVVDAVLAASDPDAGSLSWRRVEGVDDVLDLIDDPTFQADFPII